jgi:hypothetical protein
MTLGPGLFDLIAVLGKETVVRRMQNAVENFEAILKSAN